MDTAATILAVATPPGRSLRGIIRISGSASLPLVQAHLPACFSQGFSRVALNLRGFNAGIPALATLFRAPRSYTGEDAAELQLAGNPRLLQRILDSLIDSGRFRSINARRAQPGEFTARAFFNGRLSLTQAEGVAATIAARSDAELRAARLLTSGTIGALARRLADDLASALALVEAAIDFTDQEDVAPIAPRDLHARLAALHRRIDQQLQHSVGTEELAAIPWVALTGAPNAGKSALFNALLGRQRAIVSSAAGTTRDALAEPLALMTDHGPAEVMLVDLAGIVDEDRVAGEDSIDGMMQSVAREALERAELIVHCVPMDRDPDRAGEGCTSDPRITVTVRTKCDLAERRPRSGSASGTVPQSSRRAMQKQPRKPPQSSHRGLCVSAFSGAGLSDLRAAIGERLAGRAVSLAADAMALRPRHEAALRSALENLHAAIGLLEPAGDRRELGQPELIAAAMRAALDDLAALAGDITPDEVLGRIFATFCVGK